jgi:hypothetical protein
LLFPFQPLVLLSFPRARSCVFYAPLPSPFHRVVVPSLVLDAS